MAVHDGRSMHGRGDLAVAVILPGKIFLISSHFAGGPGCIVQSFTQSTAGLSEVLRQKAEDQCVYELYFKLQI